MARDPEAQYICFYPMDRRRGEQKNWYQESMADRVRMMHEHGMIGRRYAGRYGRSSPGPSASTIGNGASTCLPKTRSSSSGSFMKCASMK